MHCSDYFAERVAHKNSSILLGIDPNVSRLPSFLPADPIEGISEFCSSVIAACAPYVCGLKIQIGCFEPYGSKGLAIVEHLLKLARELELAVVMDAKRGDIGSTSEFYAKAYCDPLSPLAANALTINPFLGKDAIDPFVTQAKQHNTMLFVLAHTSNPDASMFQAAGKERLISLINSYNNTDCGKNNYGHVGAVVGATKSEELVRWHNDLPYSWLLAPGVGAQQGDTSALQRLQQSGKRILIPISRAILYASKEKDFALQAAKAADHYRTIMQ